MALTIILFICFAIGGSVLGRQGGSQPPEQAGAAAGALIAVCLLNTVVLSYIILSSRWSGWRLIAAIFCIYYGVMTFMPQIESAVFLTHLPPGMVPRLFLMGAVIAAPFSILAVLILGKARSRGVEAEPNARLLMPSSEWIWKLAVIAIVYVMLYFTFGYFVAWHNPAVREYYGGSDSGGFFGAMKNVWERTPWLFSFQILRAMLWVAIALPVIRMMKGRWQTAALALGLLFSVVMNAQLLLPNPYMPETVRMSHMLETASSNFIFGLLVGWLLTKRPALAREPVAEIG